MPKIQSKTFSFDIGAPDNVAITGFSPMDCIIVRLKSKSTNEYDSVVLFYYKNNGWVGGGDTDLSSVSISNNCLTMTVMSNNQLVNISTATFICSNAHSEGQGASGGNDQ